MHTVHTYSIDTAHVAAHITRATHLTCLRATWPEDRRHPSEDGLAAVVARERPRPTSHPPSPDLEAVLAARTCLPPPPRARRDLVIEAGVARDAEILGGGHQLALRVGALGRGQTAGLAGSTWTGEAAEVVALASAWSRDNSPVSSECCSRKASAVVLARKDPAARSARAEMPRMKTECWRLLVLESAQISFSWQRLGDISEESEEAIVSRDTGTEAEPRPPHTSTSSTQGFILPHTQLCNKY